MATVEVIGAGFGRTGTLSLKHALEVLGFGPTYHMEEVFKHPSHVALWQRYAVTGEPVWDRIFARYHSGVDFPVSCVWRELAATYPDAKVVLTVRDPERWWRSTAETIFTARDLFPGWFQRLVPPAGAYLDMSDRLIWDGLFGGRFADRDHAIAVFERHNAEVQASLPPERLLVFEVGQGWEPLCEFLGVPVPAQPFPRVNDATTTRRRIAVARYGTRALPVVAAGGVGIAASISRRRNRRGG